MVTIEGRYLGNKRVELTHGPSGAVLLTDAPKDNHGEGRSFSPTDLAAGSLGACMLTVMGIVAERHGIELRGTTVRVEKEMRDSPRRIAALRVTIVVPLPLGADDRTRLENAAKACPVHHSLHSEIETTVSFEYRS